MAAETEKEDYAAAVGLADKSPKDAHAGALTPPGPDLTMAAAAGGRIELKRPLLLRPHMYNACKT